MDCITWKGFQFVFAAFGPTAAIIVFAPAASVVTIRAPLPLVAPASRPPAYRNPTTPPRPISPPLPPALVFPPTNISISRRKTKSIPRFPDFPLPKKQALSVVDEEDVPVVVRTLFKTARERDSAALVSRVRAECAGLGTTALAVLVGVLADTFSINEVRGQRRS